MKLACLKTERIAGACSRCGQHISVAHVRTDPLAVFCESCCPICNRSAKEK